MFDRYYSRPQGDRLVPYEKTVHEHRAPTDASVQILRELEGEATRSVAMAFVTRDTAITDAVVQFRPVPAGGGTYHCMWKATVAFRLNGEEIISSADVTMADISAEGPTRAIALLRERLAAAILASLTPLLCENIGSVLRQ